jgi:transposase
MTRQRYPSDLTDAQWERIAPLIPPAKPGGHPQTVNIRETAALGLHRPAVLGHSMGAATALALAGTNKDVPGAILLEDPPAWWIATWDTSPASEERQAQMRTWLGDLKRKSR